ncbi:hypothetical protein BJV82DRAFT_602564 [Fennellomyces sp. T-0311]|nr:hypothetical protein BJV82DRAFT_602564 [Fennellomyces sp. T-0311]
MIKKWTISALSTFMYRIRKQTSLLIISVEFGLLAWRGLWHRTNGHRCCKWRVIINTCHICQVLEHGASEPGDQPSSNPRHKK